jgi:Polyketide cyclase / dehydrase and lipid transport
MVLKIVIGLGLAVAICIVLVVLIGYLLPVRHVAARAINLHKKPDDVFALVSNIENAATWRLGLHKIELLPSAEGRIRFREVTDDGTIAYEMAERKPPERLVTRISDPNLPFGGSWIYEISATPEGCRLNITERGEVYNPIFRFVTRFFLGYNRSLDKYLESVARTFGDAAQPAEGTPADAPLG